MSLHGYPEPFGSGAPVGYAQPGGSYQYHQTVHPSLYDPNAFRQFYASHLATLTFNSRPIIQNLSMIAQDYSRMSNVVVQCLEAHIRRVGPNIKLPAWYLLDAISKNVPIPYAGLFAPLVADLFLDSYYQVDLSTRSKMEEMLLTWRDGGQNGREVFGVVPQVAIERAIWQSGSASRIPTRPNPASRSNPAQISKAQVLADLEVTLLQHQRNLQANPYDTTASQQVEVLQQLRTVVQTTPIKQQELVAIDKQLRQLSQDVAPLVPQESQAHPPYPPSVPPPAQPAYVPPPPPPPPPAFPVSTIPSQYPSSSVAYPVQDPYLYSQPGPSHDPNPMSFLPPAQSADPGTAGTLSAVMPAANITDLFNSLLKAGLVSSTGTPQGTAQVAKEDVKAVDLSREAAMKYERDIMSMSITLTTSDLTKSRPGIIPFLYERMPVQCKQCAIRVSEGPVGKKQMEDHLDMHFRQNEKASQSVGRGHNRSWFVGVNDWINDVAIDAKGKRRADGAGTKAAAAAAAEQEAKLRESYVVVPTGDEAKSIQCPICKETLKSNFLEEDEEWVWMNAVRVQGRIYHATCHAETSTANSLASRLRHEAAAADRSRSGTPEIPGVRSTPPRTTAASSLQAEIKRSPSPEAATSGKKRKVEDIDNVKAENDEIPPSKKMTLSTHN